jgi:hypothetical protein
MGPHHYYTDGVRRVLTETRARRPLSRPRDRGRPQCHATASELAGPVRYPSRTQEPARCH